MRQLTFHLLKSTFRVSVVHSVNFPVIHRTFHHLSLHPQDIPSTFHQRRTFCIVASNFCVAGGPSTTFRVAVGPSVNFPSGRGTFRNIPSIFCAAARLSLHFPCIHRTCCEVALTFHAAERLSINILCTQESFINFLCNHGTISQLSVRLPNLLSNFLTTAGHSVKLRQLFVHPRDHLSTSECQWDLPSTSCMAEGLSVNFRQLSACQLDLSSRSTFQSSAGIFVNFCRHTECSQKLTETPADAEKVDESFSGQTEC